MCERPNKSYHSDRNNEAEPAQHSDSSDQEEYPEEPPRQRRRMSTMETHASAHKQGLPNRKAQRITALSDSKGDMSKRPRPRVMDYEAEAQEVMKFAAVIYKGKVMSDTAYPGKLAEKTWASEAWNAAASELDIELAYNSELINLARCYNIYACP